MVTGVSVRAISAKTSAPLETKKETRPDGYSTRMPSAGVVMVNALSFEATVAFAPPQRLGAAAKLAREKKAGSRAKATRRHSR